MLECRSPRTQRRLLGRGRAGHAGARGGQSGGSLPRADSAIRLHLHLRRRTARGRHYWRAGRAELSSDLQRARSGNALSRRSRSGAGLRPGVCRPSLARPRSAAWSSSSCARRRLAPEMKFILGGEGWGGKRAAAERALDRPRGHRRSQPGELLGAHGAEHQPGVDGQGRVLAADSRLRGRRRRRLRDHRRLAGNREFLRARPRDPGRLLGGRDCGPAACDRPRVREQSDRPCANAPYASTPTTCAPARCRTSLAGRCLTRVFVAPASRRRALPAVL